MSTDVVLDRLIEAQKTCGDLTDRLDAEKARARKLIERVKFFIIQQEQNQDCQCCNYNWAMQSELTCAMHEYHSEPK